MKYLSICSGIEAASVAFEPLGWRPLAFSEIEAFPRAVLQHHYPDTPLHGDFTVLKDEPWIVDADMLCGGTPCQAFSVAGNRQSLADDRGNLTLQFVLLADAIDHLRSTAGREPAWILWENVPGVLSTNDNAFGAFLGGLVGRTAAIPEPEGGWTGAGVVDGPTRCAAWRVLDAQHFGLAQRRQRVFVLARGGAGRWAAADALLPIIEGSRWHPAPSRGKGERSAEDACSGAGSNRIEGVDYENNGVEAGEPMGPLMKGSPTGGGRPLPVVAFAQNTRDEVRYQGDGDICGTLAAEPGMKQTTYIAFDPTLSSRPSGGGGLGTDFDLDEGLQAIAIQERAVSENPDAGPQGKGWQNDVGFTLEARHQSQFVAAPIVMATGQASAISAPSVDMAPTLSCNHEASIMVRMREGKEGGGKGPLVSEDQSLTLATANDQVLAVRNGGRDADMRPGRNGTTVQAGAMYTLQSEQQHAVMIDMQVRRLTPVECERLQGFPDGYTNIPWRGKPESPDGPRYKALGNSWAVPCARWIGERIKAVAP